MARLLVSRRRCATINFLLLFPYLSCRPTWSRESLLGESLKSSRLKVCVYVCVCGCGWVGGCVRACVRGPATLPCSSLSLFLSLCPAPSPAPVKCAGGLHPHARQQRPACLRHAPFVHSTGCGAAPRRAAAHSRAGLSVDCMSHRCHFCFSHGFVAMTKTGFPQSLTRLPETARWHCVRLAAHADARPGQQPEPGPGRSKSHCTGA
jgi:hypothetical protein